MDRKLFYENRDLFHEIFNDTDIIEDDEYKTLSDSIVKGQQLLKKNMHDYNDLKNQKQKIDDILKTSRNICFDLHTKTENLKHMCNDIKIDNLQDVLDQLNYAAICVADHIEKEFEQNRNDIETKLKNTKKTLKTLSKAYRVMRNSTLGYTCPVCIANEVDVFCSPCGHTMCSQCIGRANYCYFCRSKIDKVVKIFFI